MAAKFIEYDRVTDKLVWLSPTMSLNFVVSLASRDKQGKRKSFYFETEYPSNYIGTKIGRGIKRNMTYYFVIETQDFGNSLVLRPRDTYFLSCSIKESILPWFFGNKRIFKVTDDKLVIDKKYNPFIYQPDEYRYLSLTPMSIETDSGFKEGLRMECNGEYCDLDIDKFMDLYYTISNTDMYGAAIELINFATTAPLGANIYKPIGLGGGRLPEEDWKYEDQNIKKSSNKSGKNKFLDNK